MYLSKKSAKRFCSTDCQRTWQIGNTGFKNRRFQGGYIKCETCGEDFLVGKFILNSDRKHFCSTSCRQTWYSTVWSQSENWKIASRERAVGLLKNNQVITQTKPQIATNNMLDMLGVAYRNEESYTYYSLDNYLPEFDLAIEVMGDYWHCSPLKYHDSANDRQRNIIARDKAKHTYLKKYYGIEILYLWETDILKRPDVCKELIRHYIECGGDIPNYHSFNYSVVDDRIILNDVIVRPYQDGRTEIAC
jgi:G:T-mismatch repair DNA endonuclease (very short patch repair protein)